MRFLALDEILWGREMIQVSATAAYESHNEEHMIDTERQGYKELLRVSAPYLPLTFTYALLVLLAEERLGDQVYRNAGQIGSVFGIALAFFLGFRMNSAYDRWWEARKILGELTNTTRSFACKLYAYFGNPENVRMELRQERASIGSDLLGLTRLYLQEFQNELSESAGGPAKNKQTLEILLDMAARLEGVFASNRPFEKSDLMQHLNRFYETQGKAERIKNTPFLKIYGAFTRLIVVAYALLIPFFLGDIDLGGEKSHLELLAVPIMASVSSIFLTINRLANLYGEPFGVSPTCVPLATIFANLDRNCAEVQAKMTE